MDIYSHIIINQYSYILIKQRTKRKASILAPMKEITSCREMLVMDGNLQVRLEELSELQLVSKQQKYIPPGENSSF